MHHFGVLMDDDPLLRTVSEEVRSGDSVHELVELMEKVVRVARGLGLSAIQIGVPKRVILIAEQGRYIPMINPALERKLNRTERRREGCLSIPAWKWGEVDRAAKCDAAWTDLEGKRCRATFSGMTARCFLHELDHLNGVLMTDRLVGKPTP